MFSRFVAKVREYNLIGPGMTVIIGVSGGVDSMVALTLLNKFREQLDFRIIVAHVNHMMRGEAADLDESLVKSYAERLGLEFRVHSEDMNALAKKLSISGEDAGRRIRYSFFRTLASEHCNSVILTAHNRNDQVETVLLNIIRGSGLSGLRGMSYRTDNIIRPLLEFSRDEIEDFAEKKSIPYRDDHTNFESEYRRNSIRNELIPFIKEKYNPDIDSAIIRLSEISSGQLHILKDAIDSVMNRVALETRREIKLDRAAFDALDPWYKKEIIRECIARLNGSLEGVESAHVEEFIKATRGRVGVVKNIGKVRLTVRYQELVMDHGEESKTIIPDALVIEPPYIGSYRYGNYIVTISKDSTQKSGVYRRSKDLVYFDKSLLKSDIIIRKRVKGDRISPFGMTGEKKLKDLFIDEKIPADIRDTVPIFVHEDTIIWAGGVRRSSAYPVTEESVEILIIKIDKRRDNEKDH